MTDAQLLRQYVHARSQSAFAELAHRHADWVYSAAVRMVRDHHLAEDVTQAVFIVLAKKAGGLNAASLNGWLFKVTRYSANQALRARARRVRHEREAAAMSTDLCQAGDAADREAMSRLLDQAVAKLRRGDREITILRFYQRKSMADVAAALGISQDAAKKRVGRSVQRLRAMLRVEGEISPVVMLAAPEALKAACGSVGAGASSSAVAVSIAKGVMTMFSAKTAVAAAVMFALVLLPVGIGAMLWAAEPTPVKSPDPAATATPLAPAPAAQEAAITLSPSTELSTDELAALVGMQIWKFDVTVPDDVKQVKISLEQRRRSGQVIHLVGLFSAVKPMDSRRLLVSLMDGADGKSKLTIIGFNNSATATIDSSPSIGRQGGYATSYSVPPQYPDGAFALQASFIPSISGKRGLIGSDDPAAALKNADSVLAMKIEPQ